MWQTLKQKGLGWVEFPKMTFNGIAAIIRCLIFGLCVVPYVGNTCHLGNSFTWVMFYAMRKCPRKSLYYYQIVWGELGASSMAWTSSSPSAWMSNEIWEWKILLHFIIGSACLLHSKGKFKLEIFSFVLIFVGSFWEQKSVFLIFFFYVVK